MCFFGISLKITIFVFHLKLIFKTENFLFVLIKKNELNLRLMIEKKAFDSMNLKTRSHITQNISLKE
ncbi:hypothetical protein BpHYR1_047567 [Brachionus plicatilis]|uniref:Uncharacterized protein n=1 Tax=Brachionus plicatilis TaxID=10195 RepID=A0A3M7SRX1_BRAPC|nr:hypothetical protein BpHYR1_047567 [Brachionus plicatilis]